MSVLTLFLLAWACGSDDDGDKNTISSTITAACESVCDKQVDECQLYTGDLAENCDSQCADFRIREYSKTCADDFAVWVDCILLQDCSDLSGPNASSVCVEEMPDASCENPEE